MIVLAGASTVLLAFTGLAVDVGFMELQKRRMQAAADAGAVAAAQQLLRGDNTNYATYAKNDTAANGFTDGVNNTTVTVASPPTSGSYSGQSGYVEVAIAQPQPTTFMSILGVRTVMVKARAVVGAGGSSSACIYVLDPSMAGAYHTDGQTSLTADCGMLVNSTDGVGIDNQGSTQLQNVIRVRGGYSNQATLTPNPSTGGPVITDPLSNMAAPSMPGVAVGNTSTVLNPGYYSNGITTGDGTSVTMRPGLYYVNGDVRVGQSATLTGSGVTIYLTGQVYGNKSTVNLAAPTSSSGGAIEGVLIWSTLSSSQGQCVRLESDSGLTLVGVLYCPKSQIYLESHSVGYAAYTEFVSLSLNLIGSTTKLAIHNDYSSLPHGNPLQSGVSLAE